jgi:hypothetical protein
MVLLVKVRVKLATLSQFGEALQKGTLDNTRVRGDTWCLKENPAVGYSVWETTDRQDFDERFDPWREYYDQVEVAEVVTPKEAIVALFGKISSKGGAP